MALEWFRREKGPIVPGQKKTTQDSLWVKCESCGEIVFKRELEKLQLVCPKCSFHFAMPAESYIALLADEGTWQESDHTLHPQDPLQFKDSKKYSERVTASIKATGKYDAITIGSCSLSGFPVELGIMEFAFMGGSVGSVVGEKIARAVDRAIAERRALILVSRSGGMRMQEGMISLMQMAKTSVKLTQLGDAGLPYISVITNPTTGGTTASFSMLGDIIIAEPGALIGFAGPRVIKQTIGQDLPPGFQRSEFLLEKGFLDRIVNRQALKPTIALVLKAFMHAEAAHT
ncbi:acetyl-CoA carboxylase, carboxyltransferase subunit beta [bacterium]|nr:acetyl-CoA carboxylase, carboxyltransferase subunit beta [bacterium]